MKTRSEALTRIQAAARAFSDKVAECCRATAFNADDCRDAVGRLGRLRERYVKEMDNGTFNPVEAQELRKVFEDDVFIKGMLDVRQISEHIEKRSGGGPVVRLKDNRPIPLSAQTSAGALFAGPICTVHRPQGQVDHVNHLEQLREAEQRIQRALVTAPDTHSPDSGQPSYHRTSGFPSDLDDLAVNGGRSGSGLSPDGLKIAKPWAGALIGTREDDHRTVLAQKKGLKRPLCAFGRVGNRPRRHHDLDGTPQSRS